MGPPPSNEPPKYVILKAVGGEIGAASALAPKIGPLGLVRVPSHPSPNPRRHREITMNGARATLAILGPTAPASSA
jgi:hypothetical protein